MEEKSLRPGDGIIMTREQKIDSCIMLLVDSSTRASSILKRMSVMIEALENTDSNKEEMIESLKNEINLATHILANNDLVGDKLKELIKIVEEDK